MIIGVVQGKGGVAKTTTALNIGHDLARRKNNTLLIDLDPQRSLTFAMGLQAAKNTIADSLLDDLPLAKSITQSSIPGLSLVAGSDRLSNFDLQKAAAENRTDVIATALAKVKGQFDYVIMDFGPTLSLLNVAGICACDSLLIPVRPDYLSVQGLAGLLDSIDTIKTNLGAKTRLLGLLPVMVDKRLRSTRELLELLENNFGSLVFKTHIPACVKVSEAPSHGQTIFQYSKNCVGSTQYAKATLELLRRLNAKS